MKKTGVYEAIIAKANTITRNGTVYSDKAIEKAIDYSKIRDSKVEMIRRLKTYYDKAKAEGTLIYTKIKGP
ncbi:head maturation protease [Pectobacterium bacteriophage PM2]|uniref:Prohead core protein protease n=1 Tax=Pectobacterium bacteriophage PM2 TaxID=1429794 RepID=A0A0A0Q0B9_9CAUD|nr:head maturation protease [Pectobacterium bacteriophage PM2]AHY25026.1 hypothetical protein PM2_064 [Pectobacterium bacteriophage PM2]